MKLKIAMSVLVLSIVAAAGVAMGDDTKKEDKTQTLTGCSQKGDDAKEFDLIAQDGSRWELEGNDVDLSGHVGHTVTVAGKVEHAKAHEMKEDATGGKKSGELEVRNLTMVSDSCK